MVLRLLNHQGLLQQEERLHKVLQAVLEAVLRDPKLGARLAQPAVPPGDSLRESSVQPHWEA